MKKRICYTQEIALHIKILYIQNWSAICLFYILSWKRQKTMLICKNCTIYRYTPYTGAFVKGFKLYKLYKKNDSFDNDIVR